MRKFISLILLFSVFLLPCNAATVTGSVEKTGMTDSNRVLDVQTNTPVSGAKISLPKQHYTTYTDRHGAFELNADINGTSIMSVEKEGYKPFSLTLNENSARHPIVLGIEKSNGQDMQISSDLIHLGDDNYSDTSANANEFRTQSVGAILTKQFKMAADTVSRSNFLVIGSIVGIDTLLARSMGQNKIVKAYSSPPEVFFNGKKIAEIRLNGDGQRIKIPRNLIKPNQMNEISIHTGRNLTQNRYVDYDDIELMNLSVVSE